MLTHIETSYMMTFVKKLMELNLRSLGYGFPLVVLLNKGRALPIENFKHDILLDRSTCYMRDGKFVEDGSKESEDIYMQVLMLRLLEQGDDKDLLKIYKKVARKYNPDACVFVQSCLYNEYEDPSEISDRSMENDPEVISVISFTYFLREDAVPRLSVSPFIHKGKRKEEPEDYSLKNVLGVEDEELDGRGRPPQFDVMVVGCGWFVPYYKIQSIVQYPFK